MTATGRHRTGQKAHPADPRPRTQQQQPTRLRSVCLEGRDLRDQRGRALPPPDDEGPAHDSLLTEWTCRRIPHMG